MSGAELEFVTYREARRQVRDGDLLLYRLPAERGSESRITGRRRRNGGVGPHDGQ